jgi:hypothetical protein
VRGNAQGLTAVTWVAEVGLGRRCSGGTGVTEAAAELGSSVAAFRWPEGRGVDNKCLENFVRLMWCCCSTWQGLGDGGAVGRRRGRATAAEERRRARGQRVPVGEMENGRHYELHEGDVVLVEQELGEGRLGIELPTARPKGGAMGDGGDAREKGAGVELSSERW